MAAGLLFFKEKHLEMEMKKEKYIWRGMQDLKKNINGITFHYYFYVKNANSKTRDFIHDIQRYMYAIVGVSEL